MEKITKEIMKAISKNLMIEISDQEAYEIYTRIKQSIEAIERIKAYNFDNIEPLDFPKIVTSNEFREDVVEEFSHKEELLNCAKERKNKYIKV